ncbi:MAG TPA: hypothetical protein VFZ78_05715, partial [Flavisolibacter sp.]
MRSLVLLLTLCLLTVLAVRGQGTTCGTAIPLTLNGVSTIYPATSTTGANVVCTDNGATPVTWFSFTTNAAASCPLLNITTSDGLPCEIAMYTSCNGGQALQTASSMCFDDGTGLWAPSETYALAPNQTYYLRIKTSTQCNIRIAGQHHVPANDDCAGAFSISTTAITDNNACHTGGPEVFPSQLCAFTLENTAFYQFIVASNGSCVINISNIYCDNGAGNNNSGFQIGFFTGNCGSLTNLNCESGSGTFVQATTPVLTAGTKVYVAIDGMAGSNCRYSISGINIYGVLDAASFKNFSGWKTSSTNQLKWNSINNGALLYQVERSENGSSFAPIGTVQPKAGHFPLYTFEDVYPPEKAFYRIRQVNPGGEAALSHTIMVTRTDHSGLKATITRQDRNQVEYELETGLAGKIDYVILTTAGTALAHG